MLTLEASPVETAPVRVLDGPEVQSVRDGLKRVGCAFTDLAKLDAAALAGCRVLILSGTEPPVSRADAPTLARFVEAGGAVLAVGGGGKRLLELGLFDARGYYMTGKTVHLSTIEAYHRITFGYPGDVPGDDWKRGVYFLVRATDGPLMEVGPNATPILSAGGPYSLAAVQRLGKGRLLIIGADPQANNGEKGTDRLLANSVAFLLDPYGNQIPNSGFEEHTDLPPAQSNWTVTTRGGASSEWRKTGAAEGETCLKLTSDGAEDVVEVQPTCPIAVEPGERYTFSCQYRATASWKVSLELLKRADRSGILGSVSGSPSFEAGERTEATVPPSPEWKRFEVALTVPADVRYVRPVLAIERKGELLLDALALALKGDPDRQ
ncbi:MAG: carbohydrate binding domain-containing protein [Armatimonadetes bacterium]|nr:carbohydrate binding domain-containing protein [Armatimonadota bacterium]